MSCNAIRHILVRMCTIVHYRLHYIAVQRGAMTKCPQELSAERRALVERAFAAVGGRASIREAPAVWIAWLWLSKPFWDPILG